MQGVGAEKQIEITVVVPAYNAESTLGFCLEALSHQTVSAERYEVIVVDDGSSDQTSKVAGRFDVRYLFQKNRGPASARNLGADAAAGSLILFTDSDCVPCQDWLEEMVRPFVDSNVIAVKGGYKTRQTEIVARFAQMEFEDRYDMLRKSASIDMIDTYSAAFRKAVFKRMGGFDGRFPKANNEDTELSYRLAAAGCKMVFNPKAVVFHTHPSTLAKYLRIKFWRGYWRMIVYRRYPKKALKDSYTPNVLKIQTMLMAMSFPLCLLAAFIPAFLRPALLLWSILLISTLPFSIKTYKKDKTAGMLSPGIILLRSLVFAAGSLLGLARSLISLSA
jgi:cellulose synthase/poly-beta-1,6-N-acetylglucosamine synthase-like glycosyltransferase